MIKAAFFDIDGTLLDHEAGGIIHEDTREALKALRRKGIKVFIASGRNPWEIAELEGLRGFTADGWVLMNGQLGLGENGEVLFADYLEGKEKETILQAFREKEVCVVLVTVKGNYANREGKDLTAAYAAIHTKTPLPQAYQEEDIYMATLCGKEAELSELIAELQGCRLTYWREDALDVNAPGGEKLSGCERMAALFGISIEDCMAFGDGENDLSMLKGAGIGIAMGNGSPSAKEAADYVTEDIDKGGIVKALVHYQCL